MLGKSLEKYLSRYYDVFPTSKLNNDSMKSNLKLDITNSKQVDSILQTIEPDYIVNCAAYTNVDNSESSNFLIKNLKNISEYKSISDQVIKNQMFDKILNKSITDDFEDEEINEFRSDLVISNAVIEHVGNFDNQIKMIKNIKKLTKKLFIIITPNRNHPIEFHTYLPLIHMLPKKIHMKILSFIKLGFFSKEENLNLLTEKELIFAFKSSKVENFSVDHLRFLGFKSNIIAYANLEKININ